MATRLHFQRIHGASRLIVVPIRFKRACEDLVRIDAPDVDNRGWTPGEDLDGQERGALVGMTEGDMVKVCVDRADIEQTAVLYVSSARPDVVTVDELNPVPQDGIIKLTGVKGFYETQPAMVRVHLGRAGGPVLAHLGVCVYKSITIPLQFHLVSVDSDEQRGQPPFLPDHPQPILDYLRAVWRPCGLDFDIIPVAETRTHAAKVDTIDLITANGTDTPRDVPELRELFHQAALRNVVNIWVVRRLVDSAMEDDTTGAVTVSYRRIGEMLGFKIPGIVLPMPTEFAGFGKPPVTISDWSDKEIVRQFAHSLAHELGHFFGLAHSQNTGAGPPAKDSWSKQHLMYPAPYFNLDQHVQPTLAEPERATDVGYGLYASGVRLTIKNLKGYEEDAEIPRARTFAGEFTRAATALKASIAEVRLTSGIPVARLRKTVEGANWIDGEDLADQDGGSLRPGVYSIAGANRSVKITVTIAQAEEGDDENVVFRAPAAAGQRGILTGNVDGLEIQAGQCPLRPGTYELDAVITNAPKAIAHHFEEAQWTLETPAGTAFTTNDTLLEIYFVLDTPMKGTFTPAPELKAPHKTYAVGVWKEVLELLCNEEGPNLCGYSDPAAVVARLTSYLHSEYGMSYLMTRAAFGANFQGHMFDLAGYLNRKQVDVKDGTAENLANCGDQAAAVMAFSHALGIPVEWRAARPFGFIKPTNLMGIADCNSVDWQNAPLVEPTSADRLGFDIHCFNYYAGKIYDATIGPHLGTETLEEYLEAAVDRTPDCYEYPARQWPQERNDQPPPGKPPWWALPDDVEPGEDILIPRRYYESFRL